MYPLAEGLFAPVNQWYVAGFVEEIGRGPIERYVLDEPVVLYRRLDGSPVALSGHCPHRHFPLARGKLVGDELQCAYHGIRFAPDGRCMRVPTQAVAPAACKVRPYPVVDCGPWTWIWPGERSLADPQLIPAAVRSGDHEHYRIPVKQHHYVRGRYMLLHDNLLDLSHLEYLHASGIGSEGGSTVPETRSEGPGWVSSERYQASTPCPPYFQDVFEYRGLVQRRFGMTCHVPSILIGFDHFARAMTPEDSSGSSLGKFLVYHAITPARRHETHYFVAAGRDFALESDELSSAMSAALANTVGEDIAATEGIEGIVGGLSKGPVDVLVQGDLNCVRGRRLFESMIRAECNHSANPV
jgi:vanillate O-demethylase monooxygenase subunit